VSGRIRLATEDDAGAIAAIYAPYVSETPISFEVAPPDAAEIARRIASVLKRYPWLVCDLDGRIAGYAYAGRHHERAAYDWTCEVSIYVDRSMQRRGIGRALYASLFAVLQRLGYYNALAGITVPNDASVGLHAALGFEPAGLNHNVGFKDGRWWDVAYMEKCLQDVYPDGPAPPLNLPALDPDELAVLLATGEGFVL
jgi:phosphinothricin acetyltransferase